MYIFPHFRMRKALFVPLLLYPLFFTNGQYDKYCDGQQAATKYTFATVTRNQAQLAGAKQAQGKFCKTLYAYKNMVY